MTVKICERCQKRPSTKLISIVIIPDFDIDSEHNLCKKCTNETIYPLIKELNHK